MSRGHNGHPSRAAWNVALWIGNDEGLYNLAKRCMRRGTRAEQAERFIGELAECGFTATPDGYRYTKTSVILAFRGLS